MWIWHTRNSPFAALVPIVDRASIPDFLEGLALGSLTTTAYYLDDADTGSWTSFTPATAVTELGGLGVLDVRLTAAECDHYAVAIVYKHTSGVTTLVPIRLSSNFPQVPQVTIGPIIGTSKPTNRMTDPVLLEMNQGTYAEFALSGKDASGNLIDFSGRTLKYIQNDANGVFKFNVVDSAITISGTNNEIATVPISPTQSATATRPSPWEGTLLDITTAGKETTLVRTRLDIRPFAQS